MSRLRPRSQEKFENDQFLAKSKCNDTISGGSVPQDDLSMFLMFSELSQDVFNKILEKYRVVQERRLDFTSMRTPSRMKREANPHMCI